MVLLTPIATKGNHHTILEVEVDVHKKCNINMEPRIGNSDWTQKIPISEWTQEFIVHIGFGLKNSAWMQGIPTIELTWELIVHIGLEKF